MKPKKSRVADLKFIKESQKLAGFPGCISQAVLDHKVDTKKIAKSAKKFDAQEPRKTRKTPAGKPIRIVRLLTEMFSRVGRHYRPSECLKPEWYLTSTWTSEQRNDFQQWLAREFFMRGYTEAKSNYYASTFSLFFGWKVEDPHADFKVRQQRGNPERGRKSLAEIRKRIKWKTRRVAALERLAKFGITATNLSVTTKQLEQLLVELESGGPS